MAQYRCPQCGSNDRLYIRADLRWMPGDGTWKMCDAEDEVDCTECDHMGPIAEYEVEE